MLRKRLLLLVLAGILLALLPVVIAVIRGLVRPPTPTQTPGTTSTVKPVTNTLERIARGEAVRVGYATWVPNASTDPATGRPSGVMVDLMAEVATSAGFKVEWREVDWSTFVADLQDSRIDVMISGAYATPARAKAVAFTRPLFFLGISGVVRKGDSRFHALSDVDKPGVIVAATLGTGEYAWAKERLPKATLHATAASDLQLALVEVLDGRADLGISDSFSALQFAKQHPGAEVVFANPPLNLTPVAWVTRQDDSAWLRFLDTSLEYLDTTGYIDGIERRYGVDWLRPRIVSK
jgi:ABC-type amino acid transport substrate-binding protein